VNTITILGLASIVFCAAVTIHSAYRQSGRGQSWKESISEAWTNIAIGFTLNYILNLFILPMVGAELGSELTLINNFMIGWIYTAASFIRQMALRRYYNWRMVRNDRLHTQ
jgi:hypothetical protein